MDYMGDDRVQTKQDEDNEVNQWNCYQNYNVKEKYSRLKVGLCRQWSVSESIYQQLPKMRLFRQVDCHH